MQAAAVAGLALWKGGMEGRKEGGRARASC